MEREEKLQALFCDVYTDSIAIVLPTGNAADSGKKIWREFVLQKIDTETYKVYIHGLQPIFQSTKHGYVECYKCKYEYAIFLEHEGCFIYPLEHEDMILEFCKKFESELHFPEEELF